MGEKKEKKKKKKKEEEGVGNGAGKAHVLKCCEDQNKCRSER